MFKLKVAVLLAVLCYFVKCDVPDGGKNQAMLQECSLVTNATNVDFQTILAYEPAKTTAAKCLRACTMKQLGVLQSNNRIDKEATKKFLLIKFGEISDKLESDINSCADIKLPSDECEAAESYFRCALKSVELAEIKDQANKA